MAAIGVELQERESSLTRQLHSNQASSSDQISQLTSENTCLRHELDTTMAQVHLQACLSLQPWLLMILLHGKPVSSVDAIPQPKG